MSSPEQENKTERRSSKSIQERLANVRVSFRSDLEITRQVMGGNPCYVVRDPITLQPHHITIKNYQIATKLTDRKTLSEHFSQLVDQGLLTLSQEAEFFQFVLHLHQTGLLILPLSDGKALFERNRMRLQAQRKSLLMSWLFCRIPVLRPDAMLERTIDLVRPLFSRAFLAVWLVGVFSLIAVIGANWQEFAAPLKNMLSLQNLPLIWLLLIVLKLLHEFGHAYACKHFGGEVPEMGIFMILFTPCAYVDATSSWSFASRWHRMAVALAGMYFESLIAMIALGVWLVTMPGQLHDIATYTIALSTVITLGFNANPLMRYDGYYVFTDLLNQPNLRTRSKTELISCCKRVLFGIPREAAKSTRFQRWLFLTYGVASSAYMVLILIGICSLIAFRVPLIGLPLAAILLVSFIVKRIHKLARFVFRSQAMDLRRRRGGFVLAGIGTLTVFAVAILPMSGSVTLDATTCRSHEMVLHALVPGTIQTLDVRNGDYVRENQQLAQLQNTKVNERAARTNANLQLIHFDVQRSLADQPIDQLTSRNEWLRNHELDQLAQKEFDRVRVQAPFDGEVFALPDNIQPGAFVSLGEPIVAVGSGAWLFKARITSEQLSQIKCAPGTRCQIVHIADPNLEHRGTVRSITPLAENKQSQILFENSQQSNTSSAQTDSQNADQFEIVVELCSDSQPNWRIGTSAKIQFESKTRTLGSFLYRRARQIWNQYSLE